MLIAKYNLDPRFYGEITNGAFELSLFETSEVYEFKNGSSDAYMILYRTTKNQEYYDNNYDKIVSVYINNEIGKVINETKLELAASMIRDVMPELELVHTVMILCDSWYVKKNFVSV